MDNSKAVGVEKQDGAHQLMGSTQASVNLDLLGKAVSAALPKKQRNEGGVEIVRAFFREVNPESPLEGMVYAQMYALNAHIMELFSDAQKTISPDVREQYLKMANKLLKTFNNSMDGLSRFKRQGQQTIRVETVNVNDGGQAIVAGNIDNEKHGG